MEVKEVIGSDFSFTSASYGGVIFALYITLEGRVDLGIAYATASASLRGELRLFLLYYTVFPDTVLPVIDDQTSASLALLARLRVKACIGKRWWQICKSATKTIPLETITITASKASTSENMYVIEFLDHPPDPEAVPPVVMDTADVQVIFTPEILSYPVLRHSPQNEIILVWTHDEDTTTTIPHIYYSFWEGSSFSSTPHVITTDVLIRNNPDVAFDSQENALALWMQNKSPRNDPAPDYNIIQSRQEICYSRYDALIGSWSLPAPVTSDNLADGLPRISFDLNDNADAVWTKYTQIDPPDTLTMHHWEVYSSRYDHVLNSWSAPVALPRIILPITAPVLPTTKWEGHLPPGSMAREQTPTNPMIGRFIFPSWKEEAGARLRRSPAATITKRICAWAGAWKGFPCWHGWRTL